jgi:hypothetical protein
LLTAESMAGFWVELTESLPGGYGNYCPDEAIAGWYVCCRGEEPLDGVWLCGPAFRRRQDAVAAMRALVAAGVTAEMFDQEQDISVLDRWHEMMIEALPW